jgi:hypothetical protein
MEKNDWKIPPEKKIKQKKEAIRNNDINDSRIDSVRFWKKFLLQSNIRF